MKKLFILPLILMCTGLMSCDTQPKDYLIFKNGDLNKTENTYLAKEYFISAEEIISDLEMGNDVIFFIASEECEPCYYFEEDFCRFINDTEIAIGGIYWDGNDETYWDYAGDFEILENYFTSKNNFEFVTPSLYLAKGKEVTQLQRGRVEWDYLTRRFNSYSNTKDVYRYRTYEGFMNRKDMSKPAFLYSSSDEGAIHYYQNYLLPSIKEKNQLIDLIDFDLFSDQEKTQLLQELGLTSYEAGMFISKKFLPLSTLTEELFSLSLL